jgi:organic hydroperoxide reductase OsmC/OhrA
MYLHVCAEADVMELDYYDHVIGTMVENANGGGKFSEVMLNPVVTVADAQMIKKAGELHKQANELCFVANSVNFKVSHRPLCKIG